MAVTSTLAMMDAAYRAGTGVGAFNVLHLETAEALVAAAEQAELPVILQISENCVKFHGSLTPIAAATLAIARESTAEVAVHLDAAEDPELALAALALGFTSGMVTRAAPRRSAAEVAVRPARAEEPGLALAAIEPGSTSVMYDGAKLDYAENVRETARVVRAAHAAGVYVEAELGEIGGKDGAHAP